MSDLKVVQFSREGWREAIATLRTIADQMESGDLSPCKVGTLVMLTEGGEVEVFGFGPAADDLQILGLFRVGEQKLIEALLDAEE